MNVLLAGIILLAMALLWFLGTQLWECCLTRRHRRRMREWDPSEEED